MRHFGYRATVLGLLLFVSLSAKPQALPSGSTLLAWLDAYAAIPALDSAGLLNDRFEPGWIEKVELRTETDRFDFDRQRYSVRAQPKLPHLRKAETLLQQRQREGLLAAETDNRQRAYRDGLNLLIELATDAAEQVLLDSLREVQQQLVRVFEQRLAEPNFDVERLLDAQADLADLRLRQDYLQSVVQQAQLPFAPAQVASLRVIRDALQREDLQARSRARLQADLATIDAEMALERAENLAIIDFLQLDFRGGRTEFNDQVSVGASIQLPRQAKHIRALDELEVERLEELRNAQLALADRQRELRTRLIDLQQSLEAYDALRIDLAARAAQRQRLIEVYQGTTKSSPDALLKLRRRGLRDRLTLLQAEEQLREGYTALIAEAVTIDTASLDEWILE